MSSDGGQMAADQCDFRELPYESPAAFDRKWLEWFREEYARCVYRVDMAPAADVPFRLKGTSRLLPRLAIGTLTCTPMSGQTTADLVPDDMIRIIVSLAGEMKYRKDDDDFVLTPGMAIVSGHRGRSSLDMRSNATSRTIVLSRRLIEPFILGTADIGAFVVPADTQALRLMLTYLRMLEAEEAITDPSARHLAVMHVHDLAALLLGATREAQDLIHGRGKRAARLAAIKADIRDNLADPNLSVTTVAARQRVTPRYVHMLFEAEATTFSEYIVGQRLAQAHRMLSDPRLMTQTVSAIALHIGFNDLSYFNRTFRRRFGMTPSDVRAMALRDP
jgi:AraC-like DNA-binding protein